MTVHLQLNAIELIWFAAVLVAFYFTLRNYLESREDKEALHPLRNGRLVIANGSLRRDRIRMTKIAIMLVMGVWAAFLPGDDLSPFALLLMTFPVLLAFDSGLDNFDRRRLLKTHSQTGKGYEGDGSDDGGGHQ